MWLMFHSDVPKYLNYIIQILPCLIETSMSHSNSDTFLQTVLEPRKQKRLDFRSAKQTLVLIQLMVIGFDKFLLSDINWDSCDLFSCYRKLKIPKLWTFRDWLVAPVCCTISFSHVRSLHAWHCCRDLFRYLQVFGSNTLISKNACWPLLQNPRALMSSLATFDQFVVFPCRSSPDKDNNFGSISVSLQTSNTILAVRSRKSLCLILTKRPFLRLMVCWISNLLPHGQNVGRFAISQLSRNLTESQNCYFDSSKPCSVIGNIVIPFDTPFSMLILTNRFSFSFIWTISSCKQLW